MIGQCPDLMLQTLELAGWKHQYQRIKEGCFFDAPRGLTLSPGALTLCLSCFSPSPWCKTVPHGGCTCLGIKGSVMRCLGAAGWGARRMKTGPGRSSHQSATSCLPSWKHPPRVARAAAASATLFEHWILS